VAPISNEFRVFEMEVLAGEACLETEVRENGARFRLDYRRVYWNSRLESEHRRLVRRLLQPAQPAAEPAADPAAEPAAEPAADAGADPAADAAAEPGADPGADAGADAAADTGAGAGAAAVVCDMFAGVGPFAVPVALRGGRVYANDLNPDSARWLRHNAAANGVAERVRISELDARCFVRRLLGPEAGGPADATDTADAADAADTADAADAGAGAGAGGSIATAAAAAASDAAGAAAAAVHLAAAPPLCFGPFGHVVMNLPATLGLGLG